jgi:1-pyrroline-5-carboxylate dehydrogenase
MANGIFRVPKATNEHVKNYAAGSKEKIELKSMIQTMKSKVMDIPMVINGKEIFTDTKIDIRPPHELSHKLGTFNRGNTTHVQLAIDAALGAKEKWEAMPWQDRAAIFLKAADLLSGPYRAKMNAATMLCQSKNIYQSEIDAVAELCDFYRYNVQYMTEIYSQQPESVAGIWNRLEYRPLEGFVFALTPFNFTSIAGNLGAAPAMLGNTIVWKPADTQIYSAYVIMEILKEAGLPDGVINLVYVSGPTAGEVIFKHRDFAGIHFTGSTGVFQQIWRTIGDNIMNYKSYPRIVGETGGKDFVVAHKSANAKQVATALSRGAFEFQGQKCSAASRAYISKSLWTDVKKHLLAEVKSFKMGNPEDFTNFINAVIDEKGFDKITSAITAAKGHKEADIIVGGNFDKSKGYFIEPTVIVTTDPKYVTMEEELFGPVLTIYVFEDNKWEETLHLVDSTSEYSLTGALFACERNVINHAANILRNASGNFYINDKPTGAVVGQQPFGGARGSGTNDKAGSVLNLFRWISARTIKENFVAPMDYRYPFLEEQ